MADTGHMRTIPLPCPRCEAHDMSVPDEEDLRRLVQGVEGDGELEQAYEPLPTTLAQKVAAQALSQALSHYIGQFGIIGAGARISVTLNALRLLGKHAKITERQLEARRDINYRRLQAEAAGDRAFADAVMSEPTPDYPGKARDDAWLATRGR